MRDQCCFALSPCLASSWVGWIKLNSCRLWKGGVRVAMADTSMSGPLRAMAILGLTLAGQPKGCMILAAAHVFRERENKVAMVEKQNHLFFFFLEGIRRWIWTSSSRSIRDRLEDCRLLGRKKMYFAGRSSFWDVGYKLLYGHMLLSRNETVESRSLLSIFLFFANYVQKGLGGVGSDDITIFCL